MKTRGVIIVVFTLLLTLSAQIVDSSGAAPRYSARLLSPVAGQVLHPGQVVRVEWKSVLPNVDLGACEMEVWLSLDGGTTYQAWISPWLPPEAKYFYWTVPNTPTNAAVVDIRFGCEPGFPETAAPQPGSTFVIAKPAEW